MAATFSKRDSRYWLTRVFRREREGVTDPNYSMRLMIAGGKQRRLALDTGNKQEAATRAAKAYALAADVGWEAAVASVNPHRPVRTPAEPTVGDFILAAQTRASHLRKSSLNRYVTALRQVAADVAGIPRTKERFRYTKRGGEQSGTKAWRAQADAVKIAAFTSEALEKWKKDAIARAEGNAIREHSLKVTANTTLDACARFWSKEMLPHLQNAGLIVPPNPFKEVTRYKLNPVANRYKSKINAQVLLRLAKSELPTEAWKTVSLSLVLGLRKGEIDRLQWSHVDLHAGTVEVETTPDGDVKTGSSVRTVHVPTALAQEIQRWQDQAKAVYVVEAPGRTARPGTGSLYYRASPAFDQATDWLREKGVNGHHPLHTLRKEYGSLINQHFGLAAAAEALGHSSVRVTASHYVAPKERIELALLLPSTTEKEDA